MQSKYIDKDNTIRISWLMAKDGSHYNKLFVTLDRKQMNDYIKEILSDPDFISDEDRKNIQADLCDGSDYVDVIENNDVEGLTIQTTEINLTNCKLWLLEKHKSI